MVNAPIRESAMGPQVGGDDALATLDKAGLAGWNVQKLPMWADAREFEGGEFAGIGIKDPTTFKTAGMIDGQIRLLGTVGEEYRPVQNEDHSEFLDQIVGESGGHYASAQSFKGGKLVYVSIQLPEIVQVGGVDPVKLFLNGINSHDGSTHFMLNLSPERAWCANQLSYFRHTSIKIKHSGDIADKISGARRALDRALADVEAFGSHANTLVNAEMNFSQFERIVDQVFPVPLEPGEAGHSKRTWTNYTKLRDGIGETLVGPANSDISGTAWGGLNAVIEHLQWGAGSDKGREERIMTSASLAAKISEAERVFSAFALAA